MPSVRPEDDLQRPDDVRAPCQNRTELEEREARRLADWKRPDGPGATEWARFVNGLRAMHGWRELPIADLVPEDHWIRSLGNRETRSSEPAAA